MGNQTIHYMNLDISISDICAITISALAIYISLKNRRNNLRENLYDRQIEMFQKMLGDAMDIEDMVTEYFDEKRMDQKAQVKKLKDKIQDKIDDFTLLDLKNSFLMPEKIDHQIFRVSKLLNSISIKLNDNHIQEKEVKELGDAIFVLQEKIREFIGLEKLSRENEKLTRGRGGA